MGNPLQDIHTAAELASVGQIVEIKEKIELFESLAGVVEADLSALDPGKMPTRWRDNAVFGELQFGFLDAEKRIPVVQGSVVADVAARCQRCLEPFQLKLQIEPALLLLEPEQSADGYEDFEVWELDEQTVRPQDIVEELLIMAMPFSAMHDNMADCKAFASDDGGVEQLVTPFAELRSQMSQNETDPDQ